jgi:nucleotide-binding universal stress UspA family protein
VLFVIEPITTRCPTSPAPRRTAVGLLEERARAGAAADACRRATPNGASLRTLMQTGTPYQAIVDAATSLKAQLIVMSTPGRTGVSHLLLGSVAERVVRSATCPVLTIRVK